jgi:hypothetical protein
MSPPIDSITAAVVGVTDFAPLTDFFRGELGFAVEAEGVVPAAVADRLWGEDAGDVEVRVLAAAGAATGRIHLLKVTGPVAPAAHPHTLDLGLAGLNLYTRDIAASYEHLQAAGHPWISPPQTYEVPVGEQVVEVVEGYCLGPGGVGVVFVEPAGPRPTAAWAADPERRHTELTSVVCHVPDFDAELAFWAARACPRATTSRSPRPAWTRWRGCRPAPGSGWRSSRAGTAAPRGSRWSGQIITKWTGVPSSGPGAGSGTPPGRRARTTWTPPSPARWGRAGGCGARRSPRRRRFTARHGWPWWRRRTACTWSCGSGPDCGIVKHQTYPLTSGQRRF